MPKNTKKLKINLKNSQLRIPDVMIRISTANQRWKLSPSTI